MKRALIGILAVLAALAPATAFADIAGPVRGGGGLVWVLVIAIIVIVAAILFIVLKKRKK